MQGLYHHGREADSISYQTAGNTIRWYGNPPDEVVVDVDFAQVLTLHAEERLKLERRKLELDQRSTDFEQERLEVERQKAAREYKWKWITFVSTFLASLFSFGGAWDLQGRKLAVECSKQPIARSLAATPTLPPSMESVAAPATSGLLGTPSATASAPDITACVRKLMERENDYRRLCEHATWLGSEECSPLGASGNYKADILWVSPSAGGYVLHYKANGSDCRCKLNSQIGANCPRRR